MASDDDTSTIVTLLEQVLDAFNRHDLDAIMSFFADDCALEMPRGPDPWGRRLIGKAQVREGLASRFAGIPMSTMEMIGTLPAATSLASQSGRSPARRPPVRR